MGSFFFNCNAVEWPSLQKTELLEEPTSNGKDNTPILRVGNLFTSDKWYYSDLTLEDNKYCNPGDLLYAWSASFGPTIWQGCRSIYHYHIWRVDHNSSYVNKKWLYFWLLGKTQDLKRSGHGLAMIHITKKGMEQELVALPPLQEQVRIVAKLEEAFAEIDRAEKAYEELQTLAGVLKGQILQKAIQGKLVPQLAEEGVVEQIGVAPDEVPFEIPETWKWIRMEGICTLKSGVDMSPSVLLNEPTEAAIPYITGGSQIGMEGELLITRWTSKATNISESGDVLLTCKGTVGRTALNTYGKVHIARQIMAVRQTEYSTPQYLDLLLKWHYKSLISVAKGVIPGITRTDVLSLWVPIPPVREQVRIVEKVRELMQHVDALSA